MQFSNASTYRQDKTNASSVYIKEGNYYVKIITGKIEKMKAYELRYKVFCQELGWRKRNGAELEIDDYDREAIFFGVFDRNTNLIAFLRLLNFNSPFMLEKEFSFLTRDMVPVKKAPNVVEASRLCVAKDVRAMVFPELPSQTIATLLYKGVYHWCLNNRKRFVYLVVEDKVLRSLRLRGFPCETLCEPIVMPDGVVAFAAILDWEKFQLESSMRQKSLRTWFSRYQ